MEEQKLDSFSKILLATGQINFMAANLKMLTRDMFILSNVADPERNFSMERAKSNEIVLDDLGKELSGLMERLADYLNDIDAVSPIDIRVSKVPHEILIFGKDLVETDYDEENHD